MRAIPHKARIGRTVANTTPVAVGQVDVFVLTIISKPMGIKIAKSRSPKATLTTFLELPLLDGMYLRAMPIIAKIGTIVPKRVSIGAVNPVVFAPTISVMAIGTRIAQSNMLTAIPTMLFPLAILVHGLTFVV